MNMTFLKLGDILVATWGYNMTNNTFVQVIAVSKSGGSVTLKALNNHKVACDGFMQGTEQAIKDDFDLCYGAGNVKVKRTTGKHMKWWPWGGYLSLWDGRPRNFNHCD